MKALDAVTDKIYDDRLAATVADQELQYSRLHDRAVQKQKAHRFIARML